MLGYYLTSTQLDKGSVVLPGNWGRILNLPVYSYPFPNLEQANTIYRETVLEFVRATLYPEYPSRLTSSFCCPNIESAQEFHKQRSIDIIYEIEFDESLPLFYASWMHVCPISSTPSITGMEDAAQHYWGTDWKQHKDPTIEIVTGSYLKIIKSIG